MSRFAASLWSLLKEGAIAGIWLGPVTPPYWYTMRLVNRPGQQPEPAGRWPVDDEPGGPDEPDEATSLPAGPAPGHPERVSGTAMTPAEERIWADLKELTP